MTQKALASLDRVAIGLSGLCAIHCVATPAAVILFPVLSACLGSDERFHALLLVLVVPSSVVALGHVDYWERPMTLGATALIVMAHARNYRLCRRDGCDHESDACVA